MQDSMAAEGRMGVGSLAFPPYRDRLRAADRYDALWQALAAPPRRVVSLDALSRRWPSAPPLAISQLVDRLSQWPVHVQRLVVVAVFRWARPLASRVVVEWVDVSGETQSALGMARCLLIEQLLEEAQQALDRPDRPPRWMVWPASEGLLPTPAWRAVRQCLMQMQQPNDGRAAGDPRDARGVAAQAAATVLRAYAVVADSRRAAEMLGDERPVTAAMYRGGEWVAFTRVEHNAPLPWVGLEALAQLLVALHSVLEFPAAEVWQQIRAQFSVLDVAAIDPPATPMRLEWRGLVIGGGLQHEYIRGERLLRGWIAFADGATFAVGGFVVIGPAVGETSADIEELELFDSSTDGEAAVDYAAARLGLSFDMDDPTDADHHARFATQFYQAVQGAFADYLAEANDTDD